MADKEIVKMSEVLKAVRKLDLIKIATHSFNYIVKILFSYNSKTSLIFAGLILSD